MDSPLRLELSVALSALQAAAQLSQSIVSFTDKGAIEKDDLSPVTVADFAVQALLIATFKHAFPDDAVVGEEDAASLRANAVLLDRVWGLLQRMDAKLPCKLPATPHDMCDLIDEAGAGAPRHHGRTWVFDPIDGTRTYLRRELYAINAALLVDGRQALGAVGCPNLAMDAVAPLRNEDIDPTGAGCIVFAVRGHGAFVRPMRGGPDVRPRKLPRLANALEEPDRIRLVSCVRLVDSALDGAHEAVAARLAAPFPGCDLLPWVLRWAALALGLGNATIWVYRRRDRRAKLWDHAGAMLLFEETGGLVTDVRGRPIDVTAGRTLGANFGFVAAPKHQHARVLAAVHGVLRDQGRAYLLADDPA